MKLNESERDDFSVAVFHCDGGASWSQTGAALDAGDVEYAKMVFAALMELLVRKRNGRFAQGASLLPNGRFSERDFENMERVMDALEREGLLRGEWLRRQ